MHDIGSQEADSAGDLDANNQYFSSDYLLHYFSFHLEIHLENLDPSTALSLMLLPW